MFQTLSSYARCCPSAVDSSLERLTCLSQGVREIDIHPEVLAVLTNPSKHVVPASVTSSCTAYAQQRGAQQERDSTERSEVSRGGGRCLPSCSTDKAGTEPVARTAGFNVAIAFSLHTVLLSRNNLRDILGIIQFKNVVRLSLLGNRIDTIESCEPLSMLPQLAYLSLEFNPVTTLPHYRAHILRIGSWPKPLSASNCRLKKLDGDPVTADEVDTCVRCLLREATLLPALSRRIRLVCFLSHVARQQRVTAEMRSRGLLPSRTFGEPGGSAPASLARFVTRCGQTAITALDTRQAAHLCRLLARDHQRSVRRRAQGKRLAQRTTTGGPSEDSDVVEDSVERAHWSSLSSLLLADADDDDDDDGEAGEDNCGDGGDDVSASAHGGSNASDLLASVSDILLLRSPSTQRMSYSTRAKDALETTLCDEWSMDWFRLTVSSVDVHLCRLLLRVARMLGLTINSDGVDQLLRDWLRLLEETPAAEEASLAANVTGRRRHIAVVHTPVPSPSRPVRSVVSSPSGVRAGPDAQSADTSVVSSITVNSEPHDRGMVAATQSGHTTPSTLVLDMDADDTTDLPTVWSTSAVTDKSPDSEHEATTANKGPEAVSQSATSTTATQVPSLGSECTEVEPRVAAPIATAAPAHSPLGKPPLASAPSSSTSPPRAPLLLRHDEQVPTVEENHRELAAMRFRLDQWKRAVWCQWRCQQRVHSMQRQCDNYMRARITQADSISPSSAVLHALLPRIPYTVRKRFFFDHWRMRYEGTQMTRLFQLQCRLRQWRHRLSERVMQREADQTARRTQLRRLFRTWTEKIVPRRLVLPHHNDEESRVGTRLLSAPLAQLSTLDMALGGRSPLLETSAITPSTKTVSSSVHTAYAQDDEVPACTAVADQPGLSPSCPRSACVTSPSPRLPSPVSALDALVSYSASPPLGTPVPAPAKPQRGSPSACRYATDRAHHSDCGASADIDGSTCLRVSLPRGESPSLRPPPPLDLPRNGRQAHADAGTATPSAWSALRWSNAGLTRSVARAASRERTAPILAPEDLLSTVSVCCPTTDSIGGPYPEKDVEALVRKAGLLQRDHTRLAAALRRATAQLAQAEGDSRAAQPPPHVEDQLCMLRKRVAVLAAESGVLESLVNKLHEERREWLAQALSSDHTVIE